jgi:hypothetical protein
VKIVIWLHALSYHGYNVVVYHLWCDILYLLNKWLDAKPYKVNSDENLVNEEEEEAQHPT